jgi:SAM-dependent methyltransferase
MSAEHKTIADEFDRYTRTYSDTVNASLVVPGLTVDYFTRVKANYLIELTGKALGAVSRLSVLDVGCGVGNYHGLIKSSFARLSGCDISPESIERARTVHPDVPYSSYDGSRLPYRDDTFDMAFCICVMHHVPPRMWDHFVSEMRRVVRPGGLCLVFEHNPWNPLTLRVVDRCPFDRDAVLLPIARTKELLRSAGLSEIRGRSILNIPSFDRITRLIDRSIGVLPTGAQYYVQGTVSK